MPRFCSVCSAHQFCIGFVICAVYYFHHVALETEIKHNFIMSSPNDDQKELNSTIYSEYVKLNVGGMLFQTTMSTLTKFEGTMLAAMFSGRMERTIDKEGFVLIDRSGKYFGVILNFLRDGTVPLTTRIEELAELRAEANFFCIKELVELCDQALVPPTNMDYIRPVYFITMQELFTLNDIKGLKKPAIILELNGNYSNIRLFDELAFSYHKNILFIKHPLSKDMCVWNFYTKGKLFRKITCLYHVTPAEEISIRSTLTDLLVTLIPKSECSELQVSID